MIDIRRLYMPLQPSVSTTKDKVLYSEIYPDESLQQLIYCYWELKTTETLAEPFTYRVVADGCIDIFFELGNPQENFVMGFCKKFTEFPLEHSFHYVGVRFLPTAFPQLFKIDASELSNRFEQLQLVEPHTSSFITHCFSPQLSLADAKQLFDNYFKTIIAHTHFDDDKRLYQAINTILNKFGMVDIETDLAKGISLRQLRRLFEFYIGDTPKVFSKVVRFQNILRAKPSKQSLTQNKLFFNVGYYDQAHFIKEFKNFYGLTPSKAFGR